MSLLGTSARLHNSKAIILYHIFLGLSKLFSVKIKKTSTFFLSLHIRPGIAHKFPLLADIITEYLGKRNYAVYYGLIPQIDYRYDKPSEYFWEFVNIMGEIRDDINTSLEMAENVKDYASSDILASFLSEYVDLYTKQAFILYYQSIQEEECGNLSSFNSHFEDLIIIAE